MAKDETDYSTAKLKLVHLLYVLVVAVLAVGIGWGVMSNQQVNNSNAIAKLEMKKVDKEIFDMHMIQQKEQVREIKAFITTGFDKIDKRLEKIK